MKKFLLFSFFFWGCLSLFAEPVTMEVAKETAITFLEKNNQSLLKGHNEYLLTDAGDLFPQENNNLLKSSDESRTMYMFNIGDSAGFIIVSGDNAVYPILGYSNEGKIDIETMPACVKDWLSGYHQQIIDVRKKELLPTEEVARMWKGIYVTLKASGHVDPLCKTKWGQDPYYNDMCPYDNTYKERTVTGCPATAMAQIMKYWEYPTKGFGYHSYNHRKYGSLSAYFGNTYYDWDAMPNEVNSTNDAVALLMYHCGVAVEMNYDVAANGGSGSYVKKSLILPPKEQTCEYAFPTYFGYDSGIEGKSRTFYSDKKWKQLLKDELDNGRPVQYAGRSSGGGHTWVCDGYDENGYFHMNWGWQGYCDGYYSIDNLTPGVGGTGSGAGKYSSGQEMLIGIKPASSSTTSYDLILYDDVSINYSTIYYYDSFKVSVNIKNKGDNNFFGDYAAAIFDQNDNFVSFLDIKEGKSLQAGNHYSSNLEFSTDGLGSLYPGNYKIYICYRATGGSWSIIGNSFWHSYDTYASLRVKPYSSDITLYDNMHIVSEHTYYGDKFDVSTNIVNTGNTDFSGAIALVLLTPDCEKTYIVDATTIDLSSGYYLTNGLTFSTDSLEAPPGTYLMVLLYYYMDENNNLSMGDIVGSTSNYFNPIEIIVQEKPLEPDRYEENNSVETAYRFNTLAFEDDSASINTKGANIQNGNDLDYYSIDLEDGYLYSISGILNDKYSEKNSNYSGDMQVSYSLDGEIWSYLFEDEIDTFYVNGEGTLYLLVSPTYTGGHGTYNLELFIQRSEMIQPDRYEFNDGATNAYVFNNIQFEEGLAELNISDANIHSASDYDVYLLQFEEGYEYSIYAILEDVTNSETASYTGEAIYTYSTDREHLSELYKDTLDNVVIAGNGYIYFMVLPSDIGTLGTYNLRIMMFRDTVYLPDMYEPNNRKASAYQFRDLTFENNTTIVSTENANIHEEEDIDIYAICLEKGYTYRLTPQVFDRFDADIYTSDVEFVYKIGEGSESSIFDMEMPEPFTVVGDTVVYLAVFPYDDYTYGTYQLNVLIERDTLLLPDKYEYNNTRTDAYLLRDVDFKDNSATYLIQEVNIHEEGDIDIYALYVPDGYTYTVSTQLYDANTSQDTPYRVDAEMAIVVCYQTEDKEIGLFDETMPETFRVDGESVVLIGVHAKDAVSLGTYEIELSIERDTLYKDDAYEPNDRENRAYNFKNIQYINNKVVLSTDEANIKDETDYDFYSVDLDFGYTYTVDIRVKDKNSGMLSTYTSDVKFQYSLDGRNVPEIYDEYIPEPITIEGGTTLCVAVSGEKGTYDLEISIKRVKTSVGIETIEDDLIVFPNPCEDILYVKSDTKYSQYKLCNEKGQVVSRGNVTDEGSISTENLVAGYYVLYLRSGNNWYNKKILKK